MLGVVTGLTNASRVLFIAGLVLIALGLIVLIANPPRVVTRYSSSSIPYTYFEEIPPGWHSRTIARTVGDGVLRIEMPRSNVSRISVGNLIPNNCSLKRLVLYLFSEGMFKAENGKRLRMELLLEQNGEAREVDTIDVVINISRLVLTNTPYVTTMTITYGNTRITTVPIKGFSGSYVVVGSRGILIAYVIKYEEGKVKVIIERSKPLTIPLNTTAILLKTSGDAHGELHVSVGARCVCVVRYYLDKPLYKPRLGYYDVTFADRYLDPGNLVPSIVLMGVGLVSVLTSCYLSLTGRF